MSPKRTFHNGNYSAVSASEKTHYALVVCDSEWVARERERERGGGGGGGERERERERERELELGLKNFILQGL